MPNLSALLTVQQRRCSSAHRILPAALLALGMTGCQLPQPHITRPVSIGQQPISTPTAQLRDTTTSELNMPAVAVDTPLSVAPPEPTPADFWSLLRADFQFENNQHNARIAAQIRWYAKHPSYLDRVLERAEPFLMHIRQEIAARNMPSELVLLPIVESAFDPFAYSHGRAAGIWQFIPGTAQMFGLKQTWWYDGRRDVLASTTAALDYLQQLADRFDGDWLLALASYNAGPGNVARAISRNQKNNKPTDFWSLRLPKETAEYVPRLIALARIIAEPAHYGLTLRDIPLDVPFEVIDTGGQIDLALAAEMAQLDTDTLYRLNPGFNRWATDPDGPHHLVIPRSNADTFRAALADLPVEQRLRWERYTIRKGDSLERIARRHNTTPDLLKEANRLPSNTIVAGRTLLIPIASAAADHYSPSAEQRRLALQNQERDGQERSTHTVRSGDSLWTIARQHGVNHRSLASWNGLAPGDILKPGQQLVIWKTTRTASVTSAPATAAPGRIRRIQYSARRGDSYAGIAERFNVSLQQLRQWNRIDLNRYLQPGDQITLYVDVTRAP